MFHVFQSTCPARGTTYVTENTGIGMGFQSTCPARGTTDDGNAQLRWIDISIHVPREGHDDKLERYPPIVFAISIHVPREGHDGQDLGTRGG